MDTSSRDRALRSTNWRTQDSSYIDSERLKPLQSQYPDAQQHIERREEVPRERVQQSDTAAASTARQLASLTRVYVGNLRYIAQRDDVAKLFVDADLEVINIDMSIDRFTNRNPSYCFVDLPNPKEATKALDTLPGTKVLGRPVHVKPCVQKHNARKAATQLQLTRWGSSSSSPAQTDPVSLALPILEQRRLIVSGIPKPVNQRASDAELRELFKGFPVEAVSKVKWPREEVHETSKDAQYAFVDLESPKEAERAV